MRWKEWRQCSYIDHTNAKVLTASVCGWAMERVFKNWWHTSSHLIMAKLNFTKIDFLFLWDRRVLLLFIRSLLKILISVSFSMSSNLSTAQIDSKVASYNQKPSFWTLWNHDIWTFVVLLDRGSLRNYLEKVTLLRLGVLRQTLDVDIWQFWFCVIIEKKEKRDYITH